MAKPMGDMFIGEHHTTLRVTIGTTGQGLLKGNVLFRHDCVNRIEMAEFTNRFGALYFVRILGANTMNALVEYPDNFFMGKGFLGKGWLYVALGCAIDFLGDRIMRYLGNASMAIAAFDFAVHTVTIAEFINVIIPALAVFIDSAYGPVLVTHKTVIFISSIYR
ncbi:MAG: hypothetical protein C0403_16625 [Desulfobacterium sp.]|nr:hypothetical protein [Desulfobacterium sp.]